MFNQRSHLRRAFLTRTATLLTVLTILCAECFLPFAPDSSATATSPFFAPCVAPCFEDFDSVTAPSLPSSWTAVDTPSSDPTWTTVNNVFDSAPNSVFVSCPDHVTDNRLTSRNVGIVASTSVLTFRRQHNFENDSDGMILEISIDGLPFQDIIAAGGSFVTGGYNATISTQFLSPIAGKMAWSGNTGGFVTTTVNLPSDASFRTIKLRWRVASDNGIASPGVFVDSISLTNFAEAPANDKRENAQPILGATGVIITTNIGAAKEPFEQFHAGKAGSASIWFRWQAPDDDNFVFTTFGTSSDTLLAVYTGTFPLAVTSNDEEGQGCFGPSRTSGVSFPAIGGTVYDIVVDRKALETNGNVTLRWGRNASISGSITDASTRETFADTIQLNVDASCYRKGPLSFQNIPTGANYSITAFAANSRQFGPYPGNPSISPLAGTVTNYNLYLTSPTKSIKGTVNIPGGDTSDIKVTCISTPGGIVSRTAVDLGLGVYQCESLPVDTDYIVTASKPGYNFTPSTRTFERLFSDIFGADFTGGLATTHTISGLITQPDGTTGMSGVTVSLSGSQTDSKVTNATGNYSFTGVLHGGNYTITPSATNVTFTPTSVSFGNLAGDQSASFIATFQLELILDDKGQVAALDSMALVRDPFPILNNSNPLNGGADRNTRVTIFLSNLQLGSTEPPSAVVISLVGSNNQAYDIPAEDVRGVPGLGFTQVMFRLPDTLTPGTCTLVVKAHGLTSNMGAMKISN